MDEPVEKPQRRRRERRPAVQFPVEAVLTVPGQKAPRFVSALWHRREATADVFGLPETERPYMTRTLRIPDSAGVLVEIVTFSHLVEKSAQPPVGVAPHQPTRFPQLSPESPIQHPSGETPAPPVIEALGARPRSRVSGPNGPASEVLDEAGSPVVVGAAFGLSVL